MTLSDTLFKFRADFKRCLLALFRPTALETISQRDQLNQEIQARWQGYSLHIRELIRENGEDTESHANTDKDKRFIVFIDSVLDLDWIADFELTKSSEKALAIAEAVNARRCKHLPVEQVLEFRRLIGQALVQAIRGDDKLCRRLTAEAGEFLKDRTVERSRIWTLNSAMILLVSFLGLAAYAEKLLPAFLSMLSPNPSIPIAAMAGGVVGAFLSLVQRAGRTESDAAAGMGLHILETLTKLAAGALLGIIAWLLTVSEQSIPVLRQSADDVASIFLFAVAAGLFERLIPKMISQYAQNQTIPDSTDETKSHPN